jgi:energy-coupling factor transporter ATP-binding protein EcfA2
MQVRLAFSVSIHANRDILLMDEVLAVGDSNFQNKCIREFVRYKDMNKTVILVSHDIETVRRYCDRAMLIGNGKIKKIGVANEVVEQYLFNNMNDEEKRFDKDKKKSDSGDANGRWGSKEIVFTTTELRNQSGEKKCVFESFDDLILRLYYKKNSDVKNIVFGAELFDDADHRLFGFNTYMVNEVLLLDKKEGYIEFEFKKMPLLNGRYFITPAMASIDCSKQYDYWKNAIEFTIMNDGKSAKYLGDINFKIKINGKEF